MEDDNYNKFDCKVDSHGNVKINIYDLIANMSEEDINAVVEAFSWNMPVYKKIVENLRETYAGKNYNDDVYQLRKLFFTMPIDEEYEYADHSPMPDVTHIMIDTMKEILNENAKLNADIHAHWVAKGKLMEHLRSLGLGDDAIYKAERAYDNGIYPKNEEEKDYVLARRMSKMIDVNEFVANWCEKMYNLFNKKDEEK